MYFDTHAHFDDERFEGDLESLLQELNENLNIGYIVNPGVDVKRSKKAVELAKKYDFIYAGVGFHPHDVSNAKEEDLILFEEICKNKKVVAIGEIGLDYYYENSEKEVQKQWFYEQINLAKKVNKPIIIHDRDAHKDTMDILIQSNAKEVGGVLHCFAGSVEMAKECVKMGFYLGIGGVITFKNAKKLVEVVKEIPLTSLVLETDAPYLTPEPHRGKRNDSSYLIYIAEKIAQIKEIGVEEVVNQTTINAKKLFSI